MRRIVSIFLLLVWSIGLAGPALEDRVWCTGSDGHSGVEASIGSRCADSVLAPKPQAASVGLSHCGSCKDVSLTTDATAVSALAISVPVPTEKVVPTPLLLVPLLKASIAVQSVPHLSEHRDGSGPPPRLIEHRSVVLLI